MRREAIAACCWSACESPEGPRSSTASNRCFERNRSSIGLAASSSLRIESFVFDDLRTSRVPEGRPHEVPWNFLLPPHIGVWRSHGQAWFSHRDLKAMHCTVQGILTESDEVRRAKSGHHALEGFARL